MASRDDNLLELESWILDGEEWLMRRILMYAKRQGYTAYTSTLEDAWRMSIRELSQTLIQALALVPGVAEFEADETFEDDPISAFAVLEAGRHRQRGIDLKMFLGLFKYYRQVYLDRVADSALETDFKAHAAFLVTRVFDRLEIAFCSAWVGMSGEARLRELQETNRRMTNEKNRFLTVTESLGSPVIQLDPELRVTYANQAAAPVLGIPPGPGTFYYQDEPIALQTPGWLVELVTGSVTGEESCHEHRYSEGGEENVFEVRLHPMIDVSDKFVGTVVILHDITAQRGAEEALAGKARELERLSHTDTLTGLHNRRGFVTVANKYLQRARRASRPLSVLFGDLDNLKVINDRFGHATGDAALVAVASALRSSFRVSDVVARVGGDEFVVLMPDQGEHVGSVVLERVYERLAVELGPLDKDLEVTISAGWARYDPARHQNLDQLLADADANMYEEKRRCRKESSSQPDGPSKPSSEGEKSESGPG